MVDSARIQGVNRKERRQGRTTRTLSRMWGNVQPGAKSHLMCQERQVEFPQEASWP